MACTCTVEAGKITALCDLHQEVVSHTHNSAIEMAAKRVMNNTNQAWLVTAVRELKVAVKHTRCEACED